MHPLPSALNCHTYWNKNLHPVKKVYPNLNPHYCAGSIELPLKCIVSRKLSFSDLGRMNNLVRTHIKHNQNAARNWLQPLSKRIILRSIIQVEIRLFNFTCENDHLDQNFNLRYQKRNSSHVNAQNLRHGVPLGGPGGTVPENGAYRVDDGSSVFNKLSNLVCLGHDNMPTIAQYPCCCTQARGANAVPQYEERGHC